MRRQKFNPLRGAKDWMGGVRPWFNRAQYSIRNPKHLVDCFDAAFTEFARTFIGFFILIHISYRMTLNNGLGADFN